MQIPPVPFHTLDWQNVPEEIHPGVTGQASWKIRMIDQIRVRLVEYSPGYLADHWCKKGHIIYCIEGSMETELEDGRLFPLQTGMCYFVGDNMEAHRTRTETGCRLLIVD